MGVGFVAASENSSHYNGRITTFVVLSCAMAAMGGLLFGYDIGISGGVTSMTSFLEKFFPSVYRKMREDTKISNYCKFDSQLLTAFTSSFYIAGLFGTFGASSITKALGRRISILAGGAAFLAGTALGAAAFDVWMLIFGRVLLGFGVGFANQAVPLYLSEMAPAKYRGAFSNGFQFSLCVGAFTASLVNYATQKIKPGWGWRLSLAIAGIPAFILTLGSLFLPETPNSLIQRGSDPQKAAAMLQKIRGAAADIQAELDDLIKASEVAKAAENKRQFRNIIQKRYRPQLVMAIAIPFFQQFTGINVLGFYAPILFRTIGFRESASLMTAVIMGLTGTLSTFVAMMIVDRVGRRRLFIVGGIQMLFTQIVVGGIMAAKLGDHGGLSKGYAYLILVLILTYAVAFSFSWGPLGWLVPSEIFQLEIRSAGQSITVAVSYLFTFLLAQTLLAILCHFKAGIFFFFAGWAAVMTAFIYLLLPETTNIPIEKMDKVWKEHWFWKRIVADEDEKKQQLNGEVEMD